MSMTKKHFEAIAGVISRRRLMALRDQKDVLDDLAEDMATMLARTNPLFDRERFLKACRAE